MACRTAEKYSAETAEGKKYLKEIRRMQMKKLICLVISMMNIISCMVYASEILIETEQGTKSVEAIVSEGVTMVPARAYVEALGLDMIWLRKMQTLIFWDNGLVVRTKAGEKSYRLNGIDETMQNAPEIKKGQYYLPLRPICEAIGAEVLWEEATKTTKVQYQILQKEPEALSDADCFYYQSQEDWAFENRGSGYCWVCCYAMAISRATGQQVTPTMVAEYNKSHGSSGAFMQHNGIATNFGVQFAQAIDSDSGYFEQYDSWKGATYLKVENDEQAIAAIKEALDKHPQGVMVRYTVSPHTLLAVGYEGDTIYFHEPAYADGKNVTFEETCLKHYQISQFDFLQVIE
ncbi:MAG: copper amine oxidase N-terminal domain-containing protein [Ruminococcaceae bacterium]|nr:copper amine oxidase N-terminal domain-containing protein [Oscillospiraceae bacterium]